MGQFKHERTGDSFSDAQRSSEMKKQFKHICLAVSFFCADKERVRFNFNYIKIEIFIKKLTRKTIQEILEITNAYEMNKYLF